MEKKLTERAKIGQYFWINSLMNEDHIGKLDLIRSYLSAHGIPIKSKSQLIRVAVLACKIDKELLDIANFDKLIDKRGDYRRGKSRKSQSTKNQQSLKS